MLWLSSQTVQNLRNEGTRLEQTARHGRHLSLDRAVSHESNSRNNRELQGDEKRQRPQQIYNHLSGIFKRQRMTDNTSYAT